MIDRMKRVSELIKREISMILLSDIDDILKDITITRVDVSRDMRNAKIFYTVYEGVPKGQVAAAIKKHVKYIRGEISSSLNMKYTPRLVFLYDDLDDYQRSVDELFRKIENENNL